jgi:gliding motility-associated-like protein
MYLKNINKPARILCLAGLFTISQTISSQNLIANPSFELNTAIPNTFSEIDKCVYWGNVFGTCDYYSILSNSITSCNFNCLTNFVGRQTPKHGNFFIGLIHRSAIPQFGYPIFSNYFEMPTSRLLQPLQASHVYDFKLYYSLAEGCSIINNQLSAYFTRDTFTIDQFNYNILDKSWYDIYINFTQPQINHDTTFYLSTDTAQWQLLTGCFIAQGNEQYVSIGNFRDGSYGKFKTIPYNFVFPCPAEAAPEKTYLFLDDLSLYDLGYYSGAAACNSNTVICNNSSITIGNNIRDSATYSWQPTSGLSCSNCPNPIANPTVTTKYVLTKTLCSFITKDSITITVFTPTAAATAGPFKTICQNESVQLGVNDATAFSTYTWQPGNGLSCGFCPQPAAMPLVSTTYTLNKRECDFNTSDTVTLKVEDCKLQLPQLFTPNGDGKNDQLEVRIPFANSAKLSVYNRWGNEVFQSDASFVSMTNTVTLIWDGTYKGELMSAGTYYYLVETEQYNGEKKSYKEFVQLVR